MGYYFNYLVLLNLNFVYVFRSSISPGSYTIILVGIYKAKIYISEQC